MQNTANNQCRRVTASIPKQINAAYLTPRDGKFFEGAGVLVGLGLSERQARVYLALLRFGTARVGAVMGVTGVVRQEVGRLLLELQQMGLVRKNLTAPNTYSAMPFLEATRLLFERKAKEVTAQLCPPQPVPLPACFGAVFAGEHGTQYQHAIADARGSVEGVFCWVRFRQFCFRFEAELKAALKRGVVLRFAVEKPLNYVLPCWFKSLPKYRFELRTLSNPPDAAIIVFDGKKAAVAFDKDLCFNQGIDLWTTHRGLVAVCGAYFCRVWADASQ